LYAHFCASNSRRSKTEIERRALEELSITLIRARCPEAKGWVERKFGMLQEQLVKRFNYADKKDIDSDNGYLYEYFLPMHNARYT
jgi:hypothetical protein